jgi:hypothetical protein
MFEDKVSPISHKVQVSRLPKNGLEVTIEADEEQREQLAEEHALRSVDALKVTLNVTAWKKGGVKVAGRVVANIVQARAGRTGRRRGGERALRAGRLEACHSRSVDRGRDPA